MVGDPAMFDMARLVAEHHQAVYRYAYRLAGRVGDAEDLTQQVFLTAQQKLSQLRTAECARSWLFTILRNCFFKSCKKRQPIPAGSLELNIDTIPAEGVANEAIDQERLQQAIDGLPESYRVVLAMFYYENRSYKEIAAQLELPIGTVMSRLARAKGQLRSYLLEADGPPNGKRAEQATEVKEATKSGG